MAKQPEGTTTLRYAGTAQGGRYYTAPSGTRYLAGGSRTTRDVQIADADREWALSSGLFVEMPVAPEPATAPTGADQPDKHAQEIQRLTGTQDAPAEQQASDPLADAVGPSAAESLRGAGYADLAAVQQASDDELLAVDGIGDATLKKARKAKA